MEKETYFAIIWQIDAAARYAYLQDAIAKDGYLPRVLAHQRETSVAYKHAMEWRQRVSQ